jgi:hypothetical protein
MPHLKGPEDALPKRPFNLSMVDDAMMLGNVLDELEVHTIEVSTARSWGEGATIDHCYVRIRTSVGTVDAKRKTFAAAFLAVVAALETLQSLDGESTKGRG